jgi:predicted GNAT family acetyltransferase
MTVVLARESETLFVASLGGRVVGRCAVAISGDTWEFYSTSVDPAHEGRGIASDLVRFALAAADQAHARVIPSCWYVDGWLDRHPEYQHLREVGRVEPLGSAEDPQCRIAPAVLTDSSGPDH